ncbi:MAG: hypothetical protein LLF75_12535 [Eubacteriales bacterium]|nr:hypothetical protein [Eubacteriales bacterium]
MNLDAVAPLSDTLSVLGLGMLGIFIVTVAIILTIVLLNLITAPVKKRKRSGGRA